MFPAGRGGRRSDGPCCPRSFPRGCLRRAHPCRVDSSAGNTSTLERLAVGYSGPGSRRSVPRQPQPPARGPLPSFGFFSRWRPGRCGSPRPSTSLEVHVRDRETAARTRARRTPSPGPVAPRALPCAGRPGAGRTILVRRGPETGAGDAQGERDRRERYRFVRPGCAGPPPFTLPGRGTRKLEPRSCRRSWEWRWPAEARRGPPIRADGCRGLP